jgi:hypothetical protein
MYNGLDSRGGVNDGCAAFVGAPFFKYNSCTHRDKVVTPGFFPPLGSSREKRPLTIKLTLLKNKKGFLK